MVGWILLFGENPEKWPFILKRGSHLTPGRPTLKLGSPSEGQNLKKGPPTHQNPKNPQNHQKPSKSPKSPKTLKIPKNPKNPQNPKKPRIPEIRPRIPKIRPSPKSGNPIPGILIPKPGGPGSWNLTPEPAILIKDCLKPPKSKSIGLLPGLRRIFECKKYEVGGTPKKVTFLDLPKPSENRPPFVRPSFVWSSEVPFFARKYLFILI